MEYRIRTTKAQEFIDITGMLQEEVNKSGTKEGILVVFIPHTTAAVTVNENTDPNVASDILCLLNKVFPESNSYRHLEGNSPAHIKASLFGTSCTIIIENWKLKLGIWQGVYFCEFDGPKERKVYIKIIRE